MFPISQERNREHIGCPRDANFQRKFAGGGNSVVECDLAKVDVVGSKPIRRSSLSQRQ